MKTKKLTVKEKKFAAERIAGKSQLEAARAANYLPNANDATLRVEATKINRRPHVQQAINDALELHGATPEWAVAQLMKVAGQDEELGAKRLASKDILELHGWNKQDRPTVQLQVKNAFFQGGRTERQIIDDTQNTVQDAE